METEQIITLDYLRNNARFYLLDLKSFKSIAVMETGMEGLKGYVIHKQYEHGQGYYFDLEPCWCGKSVVAELLYLKRYDLTTDFDNAFQHANLHV